MSTIYLSEPPPSANGLYANKRKGGRFKTKQYVRWIRLADKEVMIQRPQNYTGRVDILTRVPQAQVSPNSDASNRIKAAEDLLVRMGVIPNDKMKYVRSSKAEFADVERTEIIITDVVEIAA